MTRSAASPSPLRSVPPAGHPVLTRPPWSHSKVRKRTLFAPTRYGMRGSHASRRHGVTAWLLLPRHVPGVAEGPRQVGCEIFQVLSTSSSGSPSVLPLASPSTLSGERKATSVGLHTIS